MGSTALRAAVGLMLGGWLLGYYRVPEAIAHGAKIEVAEAALEIDASFDDGSPMANAQVLIYAPNDLETPWAKGTTDDQGRYSFVPDDAIPGQWEVTVRQAGHGGTTTFAVGESDASGVMVSSGAAASSPVQKWVSIAAIIWGLVGTALFFSRRSAGSQLVSGPASGPFSGLASGRTAVSSEPSGPDALQISAADAPSHTTSGGEA